MNENDIEQWKPVPGFEGKYEVSSFGKVRSIKGKFRLGIVLKQTIRHGYGFVVLFPGEKCLSVHSIVCAAFIGPRPDGLVINHIDGNRMNNHFRNLEYVTVRENVLHSRDVLHTMLIGDRHPYRVHPEWVPRGKRHGSYLHPEKVPRGERNGCSKLKESQVREIRSKYDGKRGSQVKLAREYGVAPCTIGFIVHGQHWKCCL